MLRVLTARPWLLVVCGIVVVAAIAIPVYAHCGKCAADGKQQAEALTKAKMTLAAATTLAEVNTKGTAVRAAVHKHADTTIIEVHCMIGEKIQAVEVDPNSGKILKSLQVSSLDTHTFDEGKAEMASPAPPAEKEAMPITSEERIQKATSLLEETKKATEAGKFTEAESSLQKLDGLKHSLPENMQKQIDTARSAYDTAKAAKKAGSLLPGSSGTP